MKKTLVLSSVLTVSTLLSACCCGNKTDFTCCDDSAPAIIQPKVLESIQMQMNTSTAIIAGKIITIHPGISTRSIPPQVRCRIDIETEAGKTTQINVGWTGDATPIETGKSYIFMGNSIEDVPFYKTFKAIDDADVANVNNYLKAVKESQKIVFSAEQVPAEKPIQYQNPFGDGKFKFTLKNTSDKTVKIPDGQTFAKDVLKVFIDAKEYKLSAGGMNSLQKCELKPGQSATYTVDMLALKGVEWPNGGNRVYFTFNYAGQKASSFFYYYSKLHDPIRDSYAKTTEGCGGILAFDGPNIK